MRSHVRFVSKTFYSSTIACFQFGSMIALEKHVGSSCIVEWYRLIRCRGLLIPYLDRVFIGWGLIAADGMCGWISGWPDESRSWVVESHGEEFGSWWGEVWFGLSDGWEAWLCSVGMDNSGRVEIEWGVTLLDVTLVGIHEPISMEAWFKLLSDDCKDSFSEKTNLVSSNITCRLTITRSSARLRQCHPFWFEAYPIKTHIVKVGDNLLGIRDSIKG